MQNERPWPATAHLPDTGLGREVTKRLQGKADPCVAGAALPKGCMAPTQKDGCIRELVPSHDINQDIQLTC